MAGRHDSTERDTDVALASRPASTGGRFAATSRPIDPITRARLPERVGGSLDPIEEVPTEGPQSGPRAGALESPLGASPCLDEDEPFRDEPTLDADETPDEPTWRDAAVVPLPGVGEQDGPGFALAGGRAPFGRSANEIDVRVPAQPVRERQRPTGPVDPLAAIAEPSSTPASVAVRKAQRARRRRPTSYEGVAAKPEARRHQILRRVVVAAVVVIACAIAAFALLRL